MIHRNQLVLNGAHWSDSGQPVRKGQSVRRSVQMTNPAGFTVNVASTDEPPLPVPRCVCKNANEGVPSFDRLGGGPRGVIDDPNYAKNIPGSGYGVEAHEFNIFGQAVPDAGEDVNADTFLDAEEMEARRSRLRSDLGLDTEANPERARSKTTQEVDLRPIPGFPTKSPLED